LLELGSHTKQLPELLAATTQDPSDATEIDRTAVPSSGTFRHTHGKNGMDFIQQSYQLVYTSVCCQIPDANISILVA
jgi:hypothetical protein